MAYAKTVEEYVLKHPEWTLEIKKLRKIIIGSGLEECIKWGAPVYTWNNKNIVGIGAFKSYFGLWFFQGALLDDKDGKLLNAQEGKTRAMRQWRFQSIDEVEPELVRAYVLEARHNQENGRSVQVQRSKALEIPELLQKAIVEDEQLARQFEGFSQSKKREFAEYIVEAKRDSTKKNRLEKIIQMINAGIGLHDKYR